MPAIAQSKPKEESVIATLGGFTLPLELDRPEMFGRGDTRPVAFRFTYREVPFACTATRESGHPVLTLTGDFGALPYTAEGAERRQAVQTVVSAARQGSGLDWHVTPEQQIVMKGEISLTLPLTPVTMIAGAVTVVLRARPYLEVLLDTLAQAE
ncbi:MAG TPA: hypothetical protein VKU84_11485 [Stellaceae bacterium]|nr:hypothetical protein [Stellaceae bacterium]